MDTTVIYYPSILAAWLAGIVGLVIFVLSYGKARSLAKLMLVVVLLLAFVLFNLLLLWGVSHDEMVAAPVPIDAPIEVHDRTLGYPRLIPDRKSAEVARSGDADKPAPPESGAPKDGAGAPSTAEIAESEAAAEPLDDEPHPDWVDARPRKVGGAFQMPISVGPYATRPECDRNLPAALASAIDEYVDMYLGPEARGRVSLPLKYVRERVIEAEYEQNKQVVITPANQIEQEAVPMVLLHVLLTFDREANARIEEEWEKVIVHRRLAGLGGAAAAVLLLLSVAYGYLRLDLATAGRYRGRLRALTAIAVFTLAAAALAAVRLIG